MVKEVEEGAGISVCRGTRPIVRGGPRALGYSHRTAARIQPGIACGLVLDDAEKLAEEDAQETRPQKRKALTAGKGKHSAGRKEIAEDIPCAGARNGIYIQRVRSRGGVRFPCPPQPE